MAEHNKKYPNGISNGTYHAKKSVNSMAQGKDLMYYYSLVINRWYWLALGLLVGLSLFYLDMRYAKNVYRMGGAILIEDPSENALSKDALAQQFGFDKENVNMEDRIRTLTSTELMQRVVDSLDLNISYIQEGHVKTNDLYLDSPLKLLYWNTEGGANSFEMRVRHYDSTHFVVYKNEQETQMQTYGKPFKYQKYEVLVRRLAPMTTEKPLLIRVSDEYQMAQTFKGRVEVKQEGRSNILTMSITDEIPDRGIAIINRLAREYAISVMEGKNEIGRRTLQFMDQRLTYVTQQLYDVERNVEGFKRDRSLPLTTPEMTKYYVDRTNAVDAKVEELNIRAELVKNMEGIVSAPTGQYKSLPFGAEIAASPALAEMTRRYNDGLSKRAQLEASATGNNPMLKTADEELSSLRNNIQISLNTIKQEITDQRERYRQQLAPLENQINTMPTNERELTQIMREKGIKEALFLFLLQKREEIALSTAAQMAHVRQIERASLQTKVAPRPLQSGMFYTLLGLLLPFGLIYLSDAFSNKIYHRGDITKYLSAPFVGFIPHTRGKRNRLVSNDTKSILAESFRLLRSNLQNTSGNQNRRTILVTSAVSGDGKSFTAVNLALTLAMTGKKVILLGLDLRKPKMGIYLAGESSQVGVANYLRKEVSISNIIKPSNQFDNLYYVDCGPIPSNPAELLMSDRLKPLFDFAKTNYDFVVVDGAPIGVVADSFELKQYIDQTIIVMRYGATTVSHLKFMNDVEAENKLPNLNVILNDVRHEMGNSYNYGYYASYYYSEEKGLWNRVRKVFQPKEVKKVRRKATVEV
jgi:tyrosine-protein kinase Etk/Wzc